MFFKYLVITAVAALVTNAQSTTSTSSVAIPSGLDSCIISCSAQAASSAGCSSYTDLACVCTSIPFQTAAGACLQANCTAADVQTAQQLQNTECASYSSSTVSGASSSLLSSTATSASTTTHASSSSVSATSSGAAIGLVSSLALDGAFGGVVALAGALVGAALVL